MNKLFAMLTSVFFTACTVIGVRMSEAAPYTVDFEQGDIQIRHYPQLFVAETAVQTDYAASGSIGFKRLAGYIFGNNIQKQKLEMTTPVFREQLGEKIAMTAPVLQEPNGDAWRMVFVMPAGYDLTNLPKPVDEQILIKAIPAKKVATLRYSGALTLESMAEKSQVLLDWLLGNGYKPLSKPYSAAYDPPWTVPALRRNEVHIEVEWKTPSR